LCWKAEVRNTLAEERESQNAENVNNHNINTENQKIYLYIFLTTNSFLPLHLNIFQYGFPPLYKQVTEKSRSGLESIPRRWKMAQGIFKEIFKEVYENLDLMQHDFVLVLVETLLKLATATA
jgi:hypothetical protein